MEKSLEHFLKQTYEGKLSKNLFGNNSWIYTCYYSLKNIWWNSCKDPLEMSWRNSWRNFSCFFYLGIFWDAWRYGWYAWRAADSPFGVGVTSNGSAYWSKLNDDNIRLELLIRFEFLPNTVEQKRFPNIDANTNTL